MSEDKLDRLWNLVAQQQGDVIACREEVATLYDCLVEARILCPAVFKARLQRVRQIYTHASLDSALQIGEIALAVGVFAGPGALSSAGAVSKAIDGAVAHVRSLVRQLSKDCFVYVCGGSPDGRRTLDNAERLSLTSGRWEPLPPMLEQRAYAAAGVAAGKVYVCGGSTDGIRLSSVECFSIEAEAWEALTPMSVARECPCASVLRGRLYVCGGLDNSGRALSSAECYDLATRAWEGLPPMSERRAWPAAAALGDELYVCGGRDGRRPLSSTDAFDPAANVWQAMPPMLERRFGAAAVAVSGCLYVCGGRSGAQALSSAERLEPEADVWQPVAPMSVERFGTAAAAAAGQLYIVGGYGGGQPLRTAEMYDPEARAWRPLPEMSERREGTVAVLVGEPPLLGFATSERARCRLSPALETRALALRNRHPQFQSASDVGRLNMTWHARQGSKTPPSLLQRPHSAPGH